jgi:hypothetical protein
MSVTLAFSRSNWALVTAVTLWFYRHLDVAMGLL